MVHLWQVAVPRRGIVCSRVPQIKEQVDVARTVTRRAERSTWHAIHSFGGGVNPLTAKYLNRLSDLFFVLARFENREVGDVLWVPGANR